MPNFDERVYDQHLSEFDITPKMVKKKLEKLNQSKTPGPDGMHQRVIRELREHIAEPLTDRQEITTEWPTPQGMEDEMGLTNSQER